MKKNAIRVVMFQDENHSDVGLLPEQLRYAGVITYHDRGTAVQLAIPAGSEATPGTTPVRYRFVFDVHCPHGHDNRVWCEQNSRRMRSFGLLAAVVPEGHDYPEGRT